MRLDAAAFNRITKNRKFSPQTLEIARRLMVEGAKPRELALAYGICTQRIYKIRTFITAAHEAQRLPEGWAEATIAAPKEMLAEFERRAAAAREKVTFRRSRSARS